MYRRYRRFARLRLRIGGCVSPATSARRALSHELQPLIRSLVGSNAYPLSMSISTRMGMSPVVTNHQEMRSIPAIRDQQSPRSCNTSHSHRHFNLPHSPVIAKHDESHVDIWKKRIEMRNAADIMDMPADHQDGSSISRRHSARRIESQPMRFPSLPQYNSMRTMMLLIKSYQRSQIHYAFRAYGALLRSHRGAGVVDVELCRKNGDKNCKLGQNGLVG